MHQIPSTEVAPRKGVASDSHISTGNEQRHHLSEKGFMVASPVTAILLSHNS